MEQKADLGEMLFSPQDSGPRLVWERSTLVTSPLMFLLMKFEVDAWIILALVRMYSCFFQDCEGL